jgi:hypothetical protein
MSSPNKREKGGEEMDKRGDKRGDPDGYAFDGMGQARFLVDALGSDCWKSEGGGVPSWDTIRGWSCFS